MYELIDNDKALNEFISGAELYVVDVPTLRTLKCDEMTLQAVKSFVNNPDAVFIKKG